MKKLWILIIITFFSIHIFHLIMSLISKYIFKISILLTFLFYYANFILKYL